MEPESLNFLETAFQWIEKLGVASLIASFVSSWTSSKSKNSAVQFIKDFIALVALNIGKAQNKDDDR